MNDPVLLNFADKIATVTISRENRRNALDHFAMERLGQAFEEIDASDATVTILTGAGQKSFCAGDDIKAYRERTAEQSKAHFKHGLRVFDAIEIHSTFVIAAIEGYCIGGGLELALCADFRIASYSAHIALPEVRSMNAYPSWGGLTRLPRVVGRQTAKRVALMGDVLDGNAALNCGLADMVVDDGTTLSSAKAIAEKMAPDINREVFSTSKRVLLESEDLTTRSLHEINRLLESSLQFTGES